MSRGKWICLIVPGLLLIAVLSAFSDEALDKMIISKVTQYYSLDDNNIELEIRKNNIEIIDGSYDSLVIRSLTRKEPRGLVPLIVDIYSGKEIIESGQIRVDIRYYQNVLVTSDRIKRNHPIVGRQLKEERRDVTYLNNKPIINPVDLINIWSRRAISKNQILTSDMIEKIPAITPGEEVSVMYQMAGLDIRTRGVALENGYIGEEIRVRNNDSKKIIACTIVDSETVRVLSN
ncbi:MAG: flagellar basal body P-ring formation chaperone FlgA [Candidatus Zixiibacteriota bacterium]